MSEQERKKIERLAEEYSKKRTLYDEFARSISLILNLLAEKEGLHVQKVDFRAKELDSYKRKLGLHKHFLGKPLEEMRDLAGCRVIFYLEEDMRSFLERLKKEFKIVNISSHRSTDGYNADNVTIRLDDKRKSLTEYADFAGLLCEIQLTTTLFHSWSEIEHDIIYKDKEALRERFPKDMAFIDKELKRIMGNHIQKANYQFSYVVRQHQLLQNGKIILNTDTLREVATWTDNTQILKYLEELKKYSLNYSVPDDFDFLPIFDEIVAQATKNVANGQQSESLEKIKSSSVEFFVRMAYWHYDRSVEFCIDKLLNGTFHPRIIEVLLKLSQYDLNVVKQIRFRPQRILINEIPKLKGKSEIIDNHLIKMCGNLLSTTLEGTHSDKFDTVTFSRGPIFFDENLKEIRNGAIALLFDLLGEVDKISSQEEIIRYLLTSVKSHHNKMQDKDQEELKKNADTILNTIIELLPDLNEPLKRVIEHELSYLGSSFVKDMPAKNQITDTLNKNQEYQKFKAFVGYEIDYGKNWQQTESERKTALDTFVEKLAEANIREWVDYFKFLIDSIERDQGVLHNLNYFFNEAGMKKPELAEKFLAVPELKKYHVSLLDGLLKSDLKEKYHSKIKEWLTKGERLSGIAASFRFNDEFTSETFNKLVKQSLLKGSVDQILILLDTICKQYEAGKATKEQFLAVISKLTELKYYEWPHRVGYIAEKIIGDLSVEEFEIITTNLTNKEHIGWDTESILMPLAIKDPKKIITFFCKRVEDRLNEKSLIDAVPFNFQKLNKPLSENPKIVVPEIVGWLKREEWQFKWDAGQLLSIVFPTITGEYADILIEMIKDKDSHNIYDIIWILKKYEGTPDILAIVREVVLNHQLTTKLKDHLFGVLWQAGVVTGEMGLVHAFERKKEEIKPWLSEEQDELVQFAKEYSTYLDNSIKFEKARWEKEKYTWKKDFERVNPSDE